MVSSVEAAGGSSNVPRQQHTWDSRPKSIPPAITVVEIIEPNINPWLLLLSIILLLLFHESIKHTALT